MDPVQKLKETEGWIFWTETWADYYGPFKTEEAAREALSIYCNTYLNYPGEPREPTVEEAKRFKQLLEEGMTVIKYDARSEADYNSCGGSDY